MAESSKESRGTQWTILRTCSSRALFRVAGFLKGSAVAAVSAGALSSLVACAPSSPAPKEGLAGTAGATSVDEGIWIAAACWDNCGGRCVNRVLVRDGEVVRQGSETSHEDSFEWLQQRGCPRGRARAQQVFGERVG